MANFQTFDQWKGTASPSTTIPTPTKVQTFQEWRNSPKKTSAFAPAFTKEDPKILLDTLLGIVPGAKETARQIGDIFTKPRKTITQSFEEAAKIPIEGTKDVFNLIKGFPSFVAGAAGTPLLTGSEALGGPKEVDLGPLGKLQSFQRQREDIKKAGGGEVVSDVLPTAQWLLSALTGKKIAGGIKKKLTKLPDEVKEVIPSTQPQESIAETITQALPRQKKLGLEKSYTKNVAQVDELVNKYLDENVSFEAPKTKRSFDFGRLYTAVVDRLNPITKVGEGIKTTPGRNLKNLTRRYYGIEKIAESKLKHKTFKLDPETGNPIYTGEGLEQVLKPVRDNINDFEALWIAQRDLELAQRGIKGIKSKNATQIINGLKTKYGENFTNLENVAKEVREWSVRAHLDPLVEVGAISKEQRNAILQSNQFHAPFKRVMEEIEKHGYVPKTQDIFNPKSVPLKRIKGSERQIIDPLESLITNTYKITDFVERARVSKAVVGLRELNPEVAEVIKPIKAKLIPVAKETFKAEIDRSFFNELTSFAKKLGLKEVQTKGQAGRTLAYYSPSLKKVVRKFATSSKTFSHEIGHFFDDVFGLKKEFYKRGDNKNVAQEMSDFMKAQGQAPSRVLKPSERFAHAFEWWLTHRDLALEQLPLFSEKMDLILKTHPKLKGLLDIKPSPGASLETQTKTIFRPSRLAPAPNTLTVFEDGKPKFYQVPEDVFKAMTGINSSDANMIMKILSQPAKTLRAGATLAPEFTVRNPLRDQLSAYTYAKYGYIPGWDFAKGVFSALKKDDLYWQWAGQGGEHSMLVSLDRLTSQATLKDLLGKGDKFKVIKHPLEALRTLSEFTEKGTRLGVFKRAQRKGVPTTESVFQSREATLDFARVGSQTRALNQLIAFFNANLQGTDRMIRAFKEAPGKTTLKVLSGITLPSIILYSANKDNPRYKELPQWQKDFFWIIIPPGEKTPIVRIPKPFELGMIFATLPEHILEYIDSEDPQALTSAFEPILQGLTPEVLPTALKPAIEVATNKNFFTGRPIVSQTQEKLPPEMQATGTTSETAKLVGGLIKQSPAKIEHLIAGYTATLGRDALSLSDQVLQEFGVTHEPTPPKETFADIPILRSFVAREPIGSSSKSVDDFYQILEKSRQAKTGAKELLKQGKTDQLKGFIKSHPEFYVNSGFESISNTLSELRKRRTTFYQSTELTPEQKREAITRIDILMTDLARKQVELYKQVVKQIK